MKKALFIRVRSTYFDQKHTHTHKEDLQHLGVDAMSQKNLRTLKQIIAVLVLVNKQQLMSKLYIYKKNVLFDRF